MDWGDLPTWIGALGTVAALAAAIYAAKAAWRVVGLERIRDVQAQASRVAAWSSVVQSEPGDPTSEPWWGATIRNASDLPIYQVHVELYPVVPERVQVNWVYEFVPPGDWRANSKELYPATPDPAPLVLPDYDRPFVIALRFTDAAGRTWERSRSGVLTPQQNADPSRK